MRIKSIYEPFQHWQERGNIWLFSDPHWNDPDCELMNPNWPDAMDHIKKLNSFIHAGDTLVCLGDTSDYRLAAFINSKVRTVLITGNHDVGVTKLAPWFDEVYDGALLISPQILLSHEPVCLPFTVNFHGHVHGKNLMFEYDENGILCGVNLASDVANWEPLNLNEFIRKNGIKLPTIHRITIEKATEEKNGVN